MSTGDRSSRACRSTRSPVAAVTKVGWPQRSSSSASRYATWSILRSTSMSMYCTGVLVLQRKAPAGMRLAMTMTLLQYGEMRSGVCGQRGSGGKAFSVRRRRDADEVGTELPGARLDRRRVGRARQGGGPHQWLHANDYARPGEQWLFKFRQSLTVRACPSNNPPCLGTLTPSRRYRRGAPGPSNRREAGCRASSRFAIACKRPFGESPSCTLGALGHRCRPRH